MNRQFPGKYRAALARAPVIRTPWWGWVLLAGGGIGAVGGIWMLLRL